MSENGAMIVPARDAFLITYPLRDDATPLVHPGEHVIAGDVLARSNERGWIVAYAAILRLADGEAVADLKRHEGEAYHAGAPLATRRTGLRTRSVAAPVSGTVRTLPKCGALAVRDESGTFAYYARYAGIIRAVTEREISITSIVTRCTYAFAVGAPHHGILHIVPALLSGILTRDTALSIAESASVTVVAHIADVAALGALRSDMRGTLLVGSVSEEVALRLMSRVSATQHGTAKQSAVVVLYGVGNVDAGIATAAIFDGLDTAAILFQRLSQTIVTIPSVEMQKTTSTY